MPDSSNSAELPKIVRVVPVTRIAKRVFRLVGDFNFYLAVVLRPQVLNEGRDNGVAHGFVMAPISKTRLQEHHGLALDGHVFIRFHELQIANRI
jgi:hypothetical protein